MSVSEEAGTVLRSKAVADFNTRVRGRFPVVAHTSLISVQSPVDCIEGFIILCQYPLSWHEVALLDFSARRSTPRIVSCVLAGRIISRAMDQCMPLYRSSP